MGPKREPGQTANRIAKSGHKRSSANRALRRINDSDAQGERLSAAAAGTRPKGCCDQRKEIH
jgi:hypothetical protein